MFNALVAWRMTGLSRPIRRKIAAHAIALGGAIEIGVRARFSVLAFGLLVLPLGALPARGETNAAEEALYRAEALRTLPRDAARRLFSVAAAPARLPA